MDVADGSLGIHAWQKDLVLGFDPGRDKSGFAFVASDGGLVMSGMFRTEEMPRFFDEPSVYVLEGRLDDDALSRVGVVFVGDGTHSRAFTERLGAYVDVEVLAVDESNTTLEARKLYWSLHRPGFWTRLLPEGLRVPDRVLDDLAAWSIARRGLKEYRDIRRNKL